MFEAGAIVGRLRVRGAGLDPLLTRLRAAHLLDGVELRPSRLPPAAILCVRALRDPLPRSVRLDQPQPSLQREWQGALAAQLDDLAARAVRPLTSAVPAAAEAVVFADRAELLACLALDWRQTQILNRWWWREFLRNTDVRQAVMQAWLASPEFVPAALAHLAARGEARGFLAALTGDEIDRLTREVAGRFGLRGVQEALAAIVGAPADPVAGWAAVAEESGATEAARPARPPWHDLLTGGGPALSPTRELLLGISLSLVRRSGEARTAEFARRAGAWYRDALAAPRPQVAPPAATMGYPMPDPGTASRPSPGEAATSRTLTAPAPRGVPGLRVPERAGDTAVQAQPGAVGAAIDDAAPTASPAVPASPGSIGDRAPAAAGSAESHPRLEPAADERAAAEPLSVAREMPLEVETRFGGLFYLVNAALSLGLYGDFTQPETPDDALPIWDFLALMGEALLGAELRADPLWELLAQLGGWGGAEPGALFDAPVEWHAPDEWPAIFGPAPCRWAIADGRLRAWHPAGFWLWDIPRQVEESGVPNWFGIFSGQMDMPGAPGVTAGESAPLTPQLWVEPGAPRNRGAGGTFSAQGASRDKTMAGSVTAPEASDEHLQIALAPGHVPQPRPGALARWADWWAAYLRARLVDALGLDGAEALPAILFRYHARVLVSAARLDVMLRLDDLALAVRYAGLDRDPGWVPAAGRTIAFHFE